MTTDRGGSAGCLSRRLVVPSMVTAASIALLLVTVGGAEEPAESTPPSTAGSAPPTSTDTQQAIPAQPRVSELDSAVQRVLAETGASRLVPAAQLRRLPGSVVAVLRAEQTALTVGSTP